MRAAQVNPAFDDELVSVAPKDKPIVVVCSQGGTLEPSLAFKAGKQSRCSAFCICAHRALVGHLALLRVRIIHTISMDFVSICIL